MLIMMLMDTDLAVELPHYIEEKYSSEELESRYLHQKYDSKREYDTEYRRARYPPEYCLLAEFWWEIFRCHTDQDSIVSAHHEVDEDDVEERKCTCRSEEVSKVSFEERKEFRHF